LTGVFLLRSTAVAPQFAAINRLAVFEMGDFMPDLQDLDYLRPVPADITIKLAVDRRLRPERASGRSQRGGGPAWRTSQSLGKVRPSQVPESHMPAGTHLQKIIGNFPQYCNR